MKKYFLLVVFSVFLASCSTIDLNKDKAKKTKIEKIANIEEQLFPIPDKYYPINSLDTGLFISQNELVSWLRNFAINNQEKSNFKLLNLGKSTNGQSIISLIGTKSDKVSASDLFETGKPTVLVVAGSRGISSTSTTESILAFLTEFNFSLLDDLNLIIVPRANPDAFELNSENTADDINLTKDYLLLKSKESQAIIRLIRAYQPLVIIDIDEFKSQKQEFNFATDLAVRTGFSSNTDEVITKASREWLLNPVSKKLTQQNIKTEWQLEQIKNQADKFVIDSLIPDNLVDSASLRNIFTLSIQGRDQSPLKRKVFTIVESINLVLDEVINRKDKWQELQNFANNDASSKSCQGVMIIKGQSQNKIYKAPVITPRNTWTYENISAKFDIDKKKSLTRKNSCGYWLNTQAQTTVARLKALGINVQTIAENNTLDVEMYSTADENRPLAEVNLSQAKMKVSPKSYFVSTRQNLANLIFSILEPDVEFSYYNSGVLQNLSYIARVLNKTPNLVFEDK